MLKFDSNVETCTKVVFALVMRELV
jgi:hypothetical protein